MTDNFEKPVAVNNEIYVPYRLNGTGAIQIRRARVLTLNANSSLVEDVVTKVNHIVRSTTNVALAGQNYIEIEPDQLFPGHEVLDTYRDGGRGAIKFRFGKVLKIQNNLVNVRLQDQSKVTINLLNRVVVTVESNNRILEAKKALATA